jgi:hypothetical protein
MQREGKQFHNELMSVLVGFQSDLNVSTCNDSIYVFPPEASMCHEGSGIGGPPAFAHQHKNYIHTTETTLDIKQWSAKFEWYGRLLDRICTMAVGDVLRGARVVSSILSGASPCKKISQATA